MMLIISNKIAYITLSIVLTSVNKTLYMNGNYIHDDVDGKPLQ